MVKPYHEPFDDDLETIRLQSDSNAVPNEPRNDVEDYDKNQTKVKY